MRNKKRKPQDKYLYIFPRKKIAHFIVLQDPLILFHRHCYSSAVSGEFQM